MTHFGGSSVFNGLHNVSGLRDICVRWLKLLTRGLSLEFLMEHRGTQMSADVS